MLGLTKTSHSKPTSSSFFLKTKLEEAKEVEERLLEVKYIKDHVERLIIKKILPFEEPFSNNAGSEFRIYDRKRGFNYYYFSGRPKQLKIQDDYIAVHFRGLEVFSSKKYEVNRQVIAGSKRTRSVGREAGSPLPRTKKGLREKILELKKQNSSLKKEITSLKRPRPQEGERLSDPDDEYDIKEAQSAENFAAAGSDTDDLLNTNKWISKIYYPDGKFSPHIKELAADARKPFVQVEKGLWIILSAEELENPELMMAFKRLPEDVLKKGTKRKWERLDIEGRPQYRFFIKNR